MASITSLEPLWSSADSNRAWHWGVRRVPGLPAVALRIWLRGGVRCESTPGLASLTGRLLSEGTSSDDWQTLAARFEDHGMALSTYGTLEAHGITVDALADDWRLALEWASELLHDSVFPIERLGWQRDQTLGELASLADQPEVRTAWAFYDQLYHPHPSARPVQGTPEGLARLGPEDCQRFHRSGLERGGVVTVAGAIDPERVAGELERLFPPAAPGASPAPPPPSGRAQRRRRVDLEDTDQAHLFLGHLTVPLDHPDVPALEVAAVLLGAGSGLSGRIPTRVREREGLAYSAHVSTLSGAGIDPGRLVVYVGTSPSTLDQAERAVREELERAVEGGSTTDEVADAREYLLGREPFRRETARQWADLLVDSIFYGQPFWDREWRRRRLATVDVDQVNRVLRSHIDPRALRVTVGVPVGTAPQEDAKEEGDG